MIIHLIGQPGSGKSTLANELKHEVEHPVIIDGDDLREIFKNKDYSEEGRRRNLTNAYNIARFLDAKGFTPILAMVSPYEDLREELKANTEVKEIYLSTTQIRGREGFFVPNYAAPQKEYLHVNTDLSLDECVTQIKQHIK
jgi:adenylylsulfate kinase